MVCARDTEEKTNILVVSEKGYGKRSNIEDYRITGRGGKGVKTLSVTEKTGYLVAIMGVNDNDGLMIINRSGMTIRMAIDSLRIMGRATQGVRLINIKGADAIASIAKTPREEDEEILPIEGELEGIIPLDEISDGEILESEDNTEPDAPVEE